MVQLVTIVLVGIGLLLASSAGAEEDLPHLRLHLSDRVDPGDTVTLACTKNGKPNPCTIMADPCLATMEAAMKAREPYFENPDYQRQYYEVHSWCDKACLQAKLKDIENEEKFKAAKAKVEKQWTAAKACWGRP